MDMNHVMQIIFTVIVVCAIIITTIKVMRKNDKKSRELEGMITGFIIGSISGFYILNSLICAPIGMFLGIYIGKNMKKES